MNLKLRYDQVCDHLEQAYAQNQELLDRLSIYVDRLDDQSFHQDVLEMDLDQHKEVLADTVAQLSEKACVVEVQEYLLLSAREEVQDLANVLAEKEELISRLSVQPGRTDATESDVGTSKKRKVAC